MLTIDEVYITADPDAIYRAARDILRWPELLSHYRWVKVLEWQKDAVHVEMAARRGVIPVKWTAIQTCNSNQRQVYYRHTGGLTRGMAVTWAIVPVESGVRVTIIHDLSLEVPLVRTWLGKVIVGHGFVHPIARRTLKCIKQYLEEEAPCAVQSSPASDRSPRSA